MTPVRITVAPRTHDAMYRSTVPSGRRISLCLLFLLLAAVPLAAQKSGDGNAAVAPPARRPALHVFLDCSYCDLDFFIKEFPYVDFVHDAAEADVHVLVTDLATGSGGREYTLRYVGKRSFEGVNDELRFASRSFESDFDIRKHGARVLALGLARYVAHTAYAGDLSLAYERGDTPVQPDDPWDAWLFNVGGSGYFSGEKTSTYTSSSATIAITRVTEAWKFRASSSLTYRESTFDIDDTTTITSVTRNQSASALLVKSAGEHVSYGASASASGSTFSNVRLAVGISPTVEVNLFPYAESTWRQLRIQYSIGCSAQRYVDSTIYDKLRETLFSTALSTTFEIKQPWGSASASTWINAYLHDLGKHNLGVSASLSLRVYQGLSFDFWGSYSAVHDQLSIAKASLSTDEILLQRSQRQTQYSYNFSIGMSYTFGSIFSNVVNPRFGN